MSSISVPCHPRCPWATVLSATAHRVLGDLPSVDCTVLGTGSNGGTGTPSVGSSRYHTPGTATSWELLNTVIAGQFVLWLGTRSCTLTAGIPECAGESPFRASGLEGACQINPVLLLGSAPQKFPPRVGDGIVTVEALGLQTVPNRKR